MAEKNSIRADKEKRPCEVCSKESMGIYYGALTCAACFWFFERCLTQKQLFKPCKNNYMCNLSPSNLEKCPYCHLKKCISIGMSEDALGCRQIYKHLMEEHIAWMNITSQDNNLNGEQELMALILKAYEDTCHFISGKVAILIDKAQTQNYLNQSLSKLCCPLSSVPYILYSRSFRSIAQLSELFSPAIQSVMDFAKRIPFFGDLTQPDQILLLKAGVFEVLLVKLACMFEAQDRYLICLNGHVFYQYSIETDDKGKFLLDCMFIFAKGMNNLHLSDSEVVLFCSILLMAGNRPGLKNPALVLKVQIQLKNILRKLVSENHPENPNTFSDLMKMIDDLRVLHFIHFKRDLKFGMKRVKSAHFKTVGRLMERIASTFIRPSSIKILPLDVPSQNNPIVIHPPKTHPQARSRFCVQQKSEYGTSTSSYEWNTADSKNYSQPLTSLITMPLGNFGSQIQASNYVNQDHGPSNLKQAITTFGRNRPAETDVSNHWRSSGTLFNSSTSRTDSCPTYTPLSSLCPSTSSYEWNTADFRNDSEPPTFPVTMPLGNLGSQIQALNYVNQDHRASNLNEAVATFCRNLPAKTDMSDHWRSSETLYVNSSTTSRTDPCPTYTPLSSLCPSTSSYKWNTVNIRNDSEPLTFPVTMPLESFGIETQALNRVDQDHAPSKPNQAVTDVSYHRRNDNWN